MPCVALPFRYWALCSYRTLNTRSSVSKKRRAAQRAKGWLWEMWFRCRGRHVKLPSTIWQWNVTIFEKWYQCLLACVATVDTPVRQHSNHREHPRARSTDATMNPTPTISLMRSTAATSRTPVVPYLARCGKYHQPLAEEMPRVSWLITSPSPHPFLCAMYSSSSSSPCGYHLFSLPPLFSFSSLLSPWRTSSYSRKENGGER